MLFEAELLRRSFYSTRPLSEFALRGRVTGLRIDDGNSRDCEVALCISAGAGHLRFVTYIVELGTDVNSGQLVAVEGLMLTHYRAIIGDFPGVLIKRFKSALDGAAEAGHLDVVRYLVAAGADFGDALKYASVAGQAHIVRYLLQQGVVIHIGFFGTLTFAICGGHLETIQIVLEAKAHPDMCIKAAIRLASKLGYAQVVDYLHTLE